MSVDAAAADLVPDGRTRADDPLLLYFTPGTTAKPKMVRLRERERQRRMSSARVLIELFEEDFRVASS